MTRIEPEKRSAGVIRWLSFAAAAALLLLPAVALATIHGITGPGFDLTAREGYVSIADGGSIYSWGYSETSATRMQLPGPTLIVTAGDMVSVTLHNALPAAAGNVSIVFPGHQVTATGGVPGALTQEAPPGGSVTYDFTAPAEPGTYQYHSGTRPELQVEMGLYGALVVYPSTPDSACSVASAYDHPGTCYEREYLFLTSEIDIDIHQAAELQVSGPGPIDIGPPPHHPEYWLLNGRAGPDTMAETDELLLPSQPYNCLPRMHPGERLLLRLVGAGREMHPFHHHGNHTRTLARDGRLLLSDSLEDPPSLAGPLLFTIPSIPGQTVDAIYEWTGKDLGWDVYGHQPGDAVMCTDMVDNRTGLSPGDGYADIGTLDNNGLPIDWEWCADHNAALPVTLPDLSVLVFGGYYSGSPYLGDLGSLPPGEGGLNPSAGFTMIWHSHTERELVNNDVFPGGLMTFLIIEPPGVDIAD